MANYDNSDNMLSVLYSLLPPDADDVARKLATDFRRRRIERELTRQAIAQKAGVAMANVTRFEQKGLISLKSLILLATALGYVTEVNDIFAQPKFSTTDELTRIHRNANKKKVYPRKNKHE